jgi:hypothetical protein
MLCACFACRVRYVQDNVRLHGRRLASLMRRGNAHIYVCGYVTRAVLFAALNVSTIQIVMYLAVPALYNLACTITPIRLSKNHVWVFQPPNTEQNSGKIPPQLGLNPAYSIEILIMCLQGR